MKGTNIIGIQLKPVGEPTTDRGDMIVVHNAQNGFAEIVVPNVRLLGRIVIQYGPQAFGWLGGSMAATFIADSVMLVPSLPKYAARRRGRPPPTRAVQVAA